MNRTNSLQNATASTRKPRAGTCKPWPKAAAQERVQALERELADAEDADRRTLGDALVDGKKPPARKTGQARASLQQAKAEAEALGMPAARRGDWPPQTKRDFEAPALTTRSGSPSSSKPTSD